LGAVLGILRDDLGADVDDLNAILSPLYAK